jgi:hypothetical protein
MLSGAMSFRTRHKHHQQPKITMHLPNEHHQ